MTRVRRLVVVVVGLAATAWLSSSPSRGQKQDAKDRPQLPGVERAVGAVQLDVDLESRFALTRAIAYRPLEGDNYFALQVQPKLEAAMKKEELDRVRARPRDILIMMSTSATMAGPSWTVAQQLAEV